MAAIARTQNRDCRRDSYRLQLAACMTVMTVFEFVDTVAIVNTTMVILARGITDTEHRVSEEPGKES